MNVSRRDFLFGAAAFALGGWRLFAAPPGLRRARKPNLVFGVVSDTHLCSRAFAGKPYPDWPVKYFAAALEHFKREKVDAVVHCGDMANRGRVREMEFHAEIWRDVFGKRGPAKLFVAGNHDFRAECAGRKLVDDGMAENWERIWGEPYEEVWHKEVKGYNFFGRHWGCQSQERLVDLVKSRCSPKEGKPLFVLTHMILSQEARQALGAYRNALGFFGHWHHSAADWREIYCADGRMPVIQVPPCHPHGHGSLVHGKDILGIPIEWNKCVGSPRQGFVVRVYDDMLTIERREFGEGGSLGADWVMPFNWETGNGERIPRAKRVAEGDALAGVGTAKHPFSKGELKKVIGNPQFREGAKIEVGFVSHKEQKKQEVELTSDSPVSSCALWLKIPLADGNPDSRVYAYEVVVVGEPGTPKLHKAVYATGCNLGVGHEPNGGVTTLEIPKSELPAGKTLMVAARPLTSLGTFGKAISTMFNLNSAVGCLAQEASSSGCLGVGD